MNLFWLAPLGSCLALGFVVYLIFGVILPKDPGTDKMREIARYVSGKITDFINSGNTYLCVNLPQLQLPQQNDSHRLLHLHKNVPGVLAQINKIFADYKININGQYLKTSDNIGYVITDVNKKYNQDVITQLKKIPETIRFRVLY